MQGIKDRLTNEIIEVSAEQHANWDKGNDIWATVLVLDSTQPAIHDPPAEVQAVIDKNSYLFQKPSSLPPHREFDHEIHLLPGVPPVNAQPDRYSPQ